MQNDDRGFHGMAKAPEDRTSPSPSAGETAERMASDVVAGVRRQVNSAMQYVRECDAKAMARDVASYAKTHPVHALAGALAVGMLAGRFMRRG